MISAESLSRRVPLIVAGAYALVSATWIFTSDRVLVMLAGDFPAYHALQTYKGWGFITASSLFLYVVLLFAWRKMEHAHALLNVAGDLARLGGWRSDAATGRIDATPGVNRTYAMAPGPFDVNTALGCFSPADRETLVADRDRVIRERKELAGDYAITALDGTAKWVRIIQRPEIGRKGRITAVVGAVQDISETVALRQEAEAQAKRVQNMIDNMPDAFYLLDAQLRFTYANPVGRDYFALARGADAVLLGKTLWEAAPHTVAALHGPMARLLEDGQPITILVEVPPLKAIRRVHAFLTPDGVGIHLRDVTEEVRAQNALRDSEERYRLALKASQDVLFDWDVVQDRLVWSEAARNRYGYDPEVYPRRLDDWLCRVHPDDRARVTENTRTFLLPGQPDAWSDSYRLLRADGSAAHVFERGLSLRDASGQVVRVIGTVTDVSDLHAEQRRLRAIVDVAADAIYEYDPGRKAVSFSEGIRTTFGHDWVGEQLIPSPWQNFVHPEDRDEVNRSFREFCNGRDTRWRYEYRLARPDGSFANVRERVVAVRDDDGVLLRAIGSMEDVTLERRAEERLKQAERIETIGNLTGGVAHDFNNLLTVILGSAEMLELDPRLDEESRELAKIILRAAERGAELTSGLLAFAGKQPLAPRTLDVRAALAEIERLLQRTLPANVALRIVTAPDLWLVEADPAQMNAAILNLAVNARDAMPDGGTLTIECTNARLDPADADTTPDAHAGEYVLISVTDTGTGIPPEVIDRVFEPFFTTKPRGMGTGMGLSMVRGFALQSGGHVSIRTRVGQGTTIGFYLPRSQGERADAEAEPSATAFAGTGEHVLIVEDNPLLRPHVSDMLSALGYRVSTASDAAAALAILHQDGDVDLLFTDVVLPGNINGPRLAELARAVRPGLKVLFTSGYTEEAIVHHGRLDHGVLLLSKPYRRHDLARKLRQVMEGPE